MNTERKILYSANRHYKYMAKIGNGYRKEDFSKIKVIENVKKQKMSPKLLLLNKFYKVQFF